jgi:hypothetical protein
LAVVAGFPYVSTWSLDAVVAPQMRSWRLGAPMFAIFGLLAGRRSPRIERRPTVPLT